MKKNNYFYALFAMIFCSLSYAASEKWQLDGDSSNIDLAKGIAEYSGNARFENDQLLILGDNLKAVSAGSKQQQYIKVSGNPATLKRKGQKQFSLSALNIVYTDFNKKLSAKNAVKVSTFFEGSELNFFGHNLELLGSQDTSVMTISGNPATIEISQPQKKPILATAKQVEYNEKNQTLTFTDNIELNSGRETISAGKLIYDIKKQTITIPKIPNQRAKMIQKVDE